MQLLKRYSIVGVVFPPSLPHSRVIKPVLVDRSVRGRRVRKAGLIHKIHIVMSSLISLLTRHNILSPHNLRCTCTVTSNHIPRLSLPSHDPNSPTSSQAETVLHHPLISHFLLLSSLYTSIWVSLTNITRTPRNPKSNTLLHCRHRRHQKDWIQICNLRSSFENSVCASVICLTYTIAIGKENG